MIKAFQKGEDIHSSTASIVFNVPLEEVTIEQRSNAKKVNFGIFYGVLLLGLSNQTDLSRTESKELIDTYYATYPQLRNYINEQIDFARENGDAHKYEVEEVKQLIKTEMENALKLDVALEVEIGIGENWLEALNKTSAGIL